MIDVGKIMKNEVRLKAELDQWQAEFTAEDKQLLDRVHEIQHKQDQLKQLGPQSPDYKGLFAQITQKWKET